MQGVDTPRELESFEKSIKNMYNVNYISKEPARVSVWTSAAARARTQASETVTTQVMASTIAFRLIVSTKIAATTVVRASASARHG